MSPLPQAQQRLGVRPYEGGQGASKLGGLRTRLASLCRLARRQGRHAMPGLPGRTTMALTQRLRVGVFLSS